MTKPRFDELVARHGPTVLRVCRAILGPADAEDSWSETFLSALEAYPRLPEDANVEAWLVTIAHRKAIDTTRRQKRQAIPVAEVPHPRAEESSGRRDLDLAKHLAALPERQRLAVAYHYFAGLPYREVAAVIGGTPEAARKAASDGVARLRELEGVEK